MMNIIFIHGVGEAKARYSDILFRNIIRECKKVNKDVDIHAINQCEVIWDSATEGLIERYKKLKRKPKLKLQVRTFLKFFYGFIDPIVIQIMYYMKDKGDKKTGRMSILKTVHNKIEQYHKKYGREDIIIAHSLGSVIAFDYVFGFRRYKYSKRAKLKVLVTLGSPIPIFTTAMGYADSDLSLPKNVNKWVNILDEDDAIARHCKPFFKKIPIEQKIIDTGRNPYSSHTGYWKSKETAKIIADVIRG